MGREWHLFAPSTRRAGLSRTVTGGVGGAGPLGTVGRGLYVQISLLRGVARQAAAQRARGLWGSPGPVP